MPLRGRPAEPGEARRFVSPDAVAVEQQLAEQCLGIGFSGIGTRAEDRRALARIVGQARGGNRGRDCVGQNLNSSVPKTVRPGAIDA